MAAPATTAATTPSLASRPVATATAATPHSAARTATRYVPCAERVAGNSAAHPRPAHRTVHTVLAPKRPSGLVSATQPTCGSGSDSGRGQASSATTTYRMAAPGAPPNG